MHVGQPEMASLELERELFMIEAEAMEAELAPAGRHEIPPTDSHVGSVVTVLEVA